MERDEKHELQHQLMEYQKRVHDQESQLSSLKMILQGMQGLQQAGALVRAVVPKDASAVLATGHAGLATVLAADESCCACYDACDTMPCVHVLLYLLCHDSVTGWRL